MLTILVTHGIHASSYLDKVFITKSGRSIHRIYCNNSTFREEEKSLGLGCRERDSCSAGVKDKLDIVI